mmetsp:Transcript_20553/g.39426  ORF Transcript_20553/g.39426 Transcript_20553/m.39426 type:complete len:205 (-) Transcript_20553:4-618(-)
MPVKSNKTVAPFLTSGRHPPRTLGNMCQRDFLEPDKGTTARTPAAMPVVTVTQRFAPSNAVPWLSGLNKGTVPCCVRVNAGYARCSMANKGHVHCRPRMAWECARCLPSFELESCPVTRVLRSCMDHSAWCFQLQESRVELDDHHVVKRFLLHEPSAEGKRHNPVRAKSLLEDRAHCYACGSFCGVLAPEPLPFSCSLLATRSL